MNTHLTEHSRQGLGLVFASPRKSGASMGFDGKTNTFCIFIYTSAKNKNKLL